MRAFIALWKGKMREGKRKKANKRRKGSTPYPLLRKSVSPVTDSYVHTIPTKYRRSPALQRLHLDTKWRRILPEMTQATFENNGRMLIETEWFPSKEIKTVQYHKLPKLP